MKRPTLTLAILVALGFTTLSRADTPTPTPSITEAPALPAPTAVMIKVTPGNRFTYTNLPANTYGIYKTARRAVMTDPDGTAQMVIDEISDNGSFENRTYHYQFIYKNKIVAEKNIDEKELAGLSPDSHVFVAKLKTKNQTYNFSQTPTPEEEFEAPVAVLVFNRSFTAHQLKIFIVTDAPFQGYQPFTLTTNHYELSKAKTDPNEEIVIRDQFSFPSVWSFTGANQIDSVTRQPVHYAAFRQEPVPPGAYDDLQAKLEEKLKGGPFDTGYIYFAHLELAKIYRQKTAQNPDSPFAKMAEDETKAAMALQPQAPMENKLALKMFPLTFDCQVNQKTGVNGQYGFKLFRMTPRGKIKMVSNTLIDPADVVSSPDQRRFYRNTSGNNGFHDPVYGNQESASPSQKYLVTLIQENSSSPTDLGTLWVKSAFATIGGGGMLSVMDTGYPQVLGWHPQKDLFYFLVTAESGHGSNLWQYDPTYLRFLKIGFTNGDVHLSPNGKWIFWGDGGADTGRMTTGFNLFNIEKGVNYRLTHGFAPKCFVAWDEENE